MSSPILINLYAGPGSGKCFALDIDILMYDGSIPKVQGIKVGDLLIGDGGGQRNKFINWMKKSLETYQTSIF